MVSIPTAWTVRIAWGVLVLASIPVLLDYVEHVLSHSWAWYAWAFPICGVLSVSKANRQASKIVPAIVLILFGIAAEVVASASGMLSLGRPGFLLAASGILAADGLLSLRRFVMMALAIPIPHALLERIGEPLLFLNATMLENFLQAVGVSALATTHGVRRSDGMVFFEAMDAGWTSTIFAFGLAWFLFERRGSSWMQTLIGSGIAAVVGFAVHLLFTTALFGLVEPSAISDARIWRDVLSYSAIAVGTGGYWVLRLRANPEAS
jgi:hypothetical protein